METPHLELREGDENIFELYKDGLPSGRLFNGEDDEPVDLREEFFGMNPAGLPVEKEITLHILIDGKETWVAFVELLWDGRFLTVNVHCHFDEPQEEGYEYLLNLYVLTSKVMAESLNHGFIKEKVSRIGECADFKKKFSSKGTLRDKIKTSIAIIESIKANVENEMAEAVSKRSFFTNVPDMTEKKAEKKK
jgi:hypothetical protein